jgi:hypothetical protein
MPTPLPLLAYLVLASGSLCGLAVALYRHDRESPELRSAALLMVSIGAIVLAFASVLWVGGRRALQQAQMVPLRLYAANVHAGLSGSP